MIKRFLSILLSSIMCVAILPMMAFATTDCDVYVKNTDVNSSIVLPALASEAPTDVRIYVDDVSISTEDLDGDTVVRVPVSIENNPGLLSLRLLFRLDARLQFKNMDAAGTLNEGFGDINIGTRTDWNGEIEVNGFSKKFKFYDDGDFLELRIVVPEGTGVGTYPITLLETCGDDEVFIIVENFSGGRYGPEAFSILKSGSITITDPNQEPLPTPSPTPSPEPSGEPTPTPSGEPSPMPTNEPTPVPSGEPSGKPIPTTEPTPTVPPTQKPTGNATKSAGEFVERCYNVCLGRSSDAEGYKYWLDMLNSGDSCGAEVGYGFVFSPEYILKNTSNEQFVKDMYAMFFGREADEGGFNSWVEQLNNGASRLQVYAGFASSPEFTNLCSEYGVIGVSILNDDAINEAGDIGKFVGRLYKICLTRYPDYCGFTAWTKGLQEGSKTGSSCAYGFIFSGEFLSRGLSNEEFVVYMYQVFFDREADEAGYNLWLGVLNNGGSYEEVFNGFTGSPEFAALCASYGINA